MTVTHRLRGLVALAASAALIASATGPTALATTAESRPSSAASVTASVIRGHCIGGGSLVLRVQASGGDYVLTASARRLPDDVRWRGGMSEESSGDSSDYFDREFRTSSVDGAWSVTRTVPAVDTPSFTVIAFTRGRSEDNPDAFCIVYVQPAQPFLGLTFCDRPGPLGLVATRRADGRLVVRYAAGISLEPGTRWSVTLAATESDGGSTIRSLDTVGPRGVLIGKATFTGLSNPRLRLTVANKSGKGCSMVIGRSFDPSHAAALDRLERRLSPAQTWRSLGAVMAAQRSHVQLR